MAVVKHKDINTEKMRCYSSIFSSTSFNNLFIKDDYSFITNKVMRYDLDNLGIKFTSYLDYLKYIYRELQKHYRCEYIYKNSIINELLLKKYGTKETVVFNEFKVGKSVADTVLFNGTSKAFEIKTELDSTKRLDGQLFHYTKIFKECYIVTHEDLINKYISTDESIGIIAFKSFQGALKLTEIRPAIINQKIDADVLIRSIRTSEYKNIVKTYYGTLPEMNSFDMFDKCYNLLCAIPDETLHQLFINQLKKRRNNTKELISFPKELRQLCLSMNLSSLKYNELENKLNIPIRI